MRAHLQQPGNHYNSNQAWNESYSDYRKYVRLFNKGRGKSHPRSRDRDESAPPLAKGTRVGTSSSFVFPFPDLAKRSSRENSRLVVNALERRVMETGYIYPLATLRPSLRRRLYEARTAS